jgi:hypothetical protein
MRQHPKHCSEQADQSDHSDPLVRVSGTKCCGRKENSGGNVLSQDNELALQVTPKDRLFTNTRRNGERYPHSYFGTPMRKYEIHSTSQGGDTQELAQDKKDTCRNYPECRSDSNIPEQLADGLPPVSQNNYESCAPMPHSRDHKSEQEPFKEEGLE